MITVFLVDDHAPTRAVLRLRLELEPDLRVIGEAESGADTLARVIALAPLVIILDAVAPIVDAASAVSLVGAFTAYSPVVVLSLYDDAATRAHLAGAGVRAIVSKHAPEGHLLTAIRAVALQPNP